MIRAAQRLMLAIRGRRQIRYIPTSTFYLILSSLKRDGWNTCYDYQDFDAWTQYVRQDLQRSGGTLRCEWTNEAAGKLTGPARLLKEVAISFGLCDPGGDNGQWL